jgi:heme exporter protein A
LLSSTKSVVVWPKSSTRRPEGDKPALALATAPEQGERRMIRLAADDLACVRGGREIFRHLSFAVRGGETLAIMGPNGAGKSSLLRLIAGLIRPSRGQITLAGGEDDLTLGEQSHYLGHQDALKPSLTVAENLAFWSDFLGRSTDPAAVLLKVGLAPLAYLPVAYLSAGQRRRLGLARLLATRRLIWLLDEPSASLDTAGRELLAGMMASHAAGGGIVAVAAHGPPGGGPFKELRLAAKPVDQGAPVEIDRGEQG